MRLFPSLRSVGSCLALALLAAAPLTADDEAGAPSGQKTSRSESSSNSQSKRSSGSSSSGNSSTRRQASVKENGRDICVEEDGSGITVKITDPAVNGGKQQVVTATTPQELLAKHPEAFQLYRQHLGNTSAKASGRAGKGARSSASSGGNARAGGRALGRAGGRGQAGGFGGGQAGGFGGGIELPGGGQIPGVQDARETLRQQMRQQLNDASTPAELKELIEQALQDLDKEP